MNKQFIGNDFTKTSQSIDKLSPDKVLHIALIVAVYSGILLYINCRCAFWYFTVVVYFLCACLLSLLF